MSGDPNGTRWSRSEKNVGRSLLERSGWTAGEGLGRGGEGVTENIKTRRKDNITGIGYEGNVHETWSTQSVGFADVLDRIKSAVVYTSKESDDDDDENNNNNKSDESDNNNNNNNKGGPSGGRHAGMYAKRHALKTELLRTKNDASSKEILGSASSSRKRTRESSDEKKENEKSQQSTLRSPVLQRLMVRVAQHEPRPHDAATDETVHITKPQPRPAKCTDTPFLAKE